MLTTPTYFTFLIIQIDNAISIRETNIEFDKISQWCDANKLTVNISKTEYMLIKSHHKDDVIHDPVTLKGIPVKKAENVTFVGIHLDNNLTWINHVREIKKKSV